MYAITHTADKLQIILSAPCPHIEVVLHTGQRLIFSDPAPALPPVLKIEPVKRLAAQFLVYLADNENRKRHTVTGYRRRLGQFTAWLERTGKNPGEPDTWEQYYHSLKKRGLSTHTRKGHYHILARFARRLVELGHLPANPMNTLLPPDPPKDARPRGISREHIRAMLAEAKTPRDRALLLFYRDTGARAVEPLSLTWGDLDINEGTGEIIGKGDKARTLFFSAITRRALLAYRQTVKHGKNDPLWQSRRGPLSYDGLYKIFKRLAVEAGVEDASFNPHAWRHAFGRDTTRAGMPTATLQRLMGHSSITVTEIYTKADPGDLQAAHAQYSPVAADFDSLNSA